MITKKCTQCDNTFEVFEYRAETALFCSKECKSKHGRIKIVCEYCGIIFEREKSTFDEHNYCSRSCSYADEKRKIRIGETNKLSENKGYMHRSYIKGIRNSPETEFKPGWQKTPEGKEIIKKRIESISVSGPTKPELKIMKLIQEFDLPYEFVGDGGLLIGSKTPDFVNIVGERRLIEVYSDYWHDPKICKYWHQTEEGALSYYSEYGYKTLILWESDINENLELIAQRILDFSYESLIIDQIPENTIEIFKDFANDQFKGNFGMALKFLVDNLIISDPRIAELWMAIDDLKVQLSTMGNATATAVSKPEEPSDEAVYKTMLNGRKILIKSKS
jgi:G:T-mismatch repair DNA endonuclease (very short patch repair protein)